jgi:hypothetical protein
MINHKEGFQIYIYIYIDLYIHSTVNTVVARIWLTNFERTYVKEWRFMYYTAFVTCLTSINVKQR